MRRRADASRPSRSFLGYHSQPRGVPPSLQEGALGRGPPRHTAPAAAEGARARAAPAASAGRQEEEEEEGELVPPYVPRRVGRRGRSSARSAGQLASRAAASSELAAADRAGCRLSRSRSSRASSSAAPPPAEEPPWKHADGRARDGRGRAHALDHPQALEGAATRGSTKRCPSPTSTRLNDVSFAFPALLSPRARAPASSSRAPRRRGAPPPWRPTPHGVPTTRGACRPCASLALRRRRRRRR